MSSGIKGFGEESERPSSRPPAAADCNFSRRTRSAEVKVITTHTRKRTIGEDFAAPRAPKPRKPPNTPSDRRRRNAMEAEEIRESGDWESAKPGHFVALYAACHEKIYGFAPSELEVGKEYALAVLAASRMLRTEFAGKPEVMVEFMRWTWNREHQREKWRRERNQGGQRVGWRLQFNCSLLSDYKVDLARRNGG